MEVIREAIIKVRLETSGEKFVVPGLADAKKLVEGYEKAIRQSEAAKRDVAALSEAVARQLKEESSAAAAAAAAERQRREEERAAKRAAREEEAERRRQEKEAAAEAARLLKEQAAAAAEAERKRRSDEAAANKAAKEAAALKRQQEKEAAAAAAEAERKRKAAIQAEAEATKAAAEQARLAAQESERAIAAEQRRQASALRSAEALKQAGEGAFTFARGLALLGVTAESDLAKVVQQIARAQAAFDLYKGSVDVVKGVTESIESLKVATDSATASQALLRAGASSLASVFAPAGILLAGIAAVGGATFKLYSDWAKAQQSLEQSARDSIRRTRAEVRAAQAARLTGETAAKDAGVATAQAALTLAQTAGDPEGIARAQAALERATIAALRTRGKQLADRETDPRLTPEEFNANLQARAQNRIDQATAESGFAVDRAQSQAEAINQRRERAQQLIDERRQVREELRQLESRRSPDDAIGPDPERFLELSQKLESIDAKNPAKVLADATAQLQELQEETVRIVSEQQSIIARQQANLAELAARQQALTNQLDNAPKD